MVKPEWGLKRACPVCASRFYDLNKKPPTCPKCGATVELTVKNSRRSKADKQKELDADALLNVDIDFGDADIIVDDALIDEDPLEDALDEIDVER
ncbi:MAG: hypothetical protein HEEMFOPI_01539 [Holosporales bacterium]